MVELRLESLGEADLPKECFVSVRLGDTQKLSRLASSRVYRFPQAANRRYGKIEVFRRIGACSIDVDPESAGMREVSINCAEGGFGNLGLRIGVEGEEAAKPKAVELPAATKEGSKVKAAKEYLSKHGLEVLLSEAMQAVLRERPADPAEFLAAKLLADKPTAAELKIPVSNKSSPKHQARKVVPTQAAPLAHPMVQSVLPFSSFFQNNFKSMDAQAFARCHARFVAKLAKPTPAPAAAARTGRAQAVLPFSSFYQSNFKSMDAQAFARCHASFTAKLAKPTPPPAAPTRTRPAVGHRHVAKAAPARPNVVGMLPFSSFYQSNFKSMDAQAFAQCHARFTTKRAKPTPAPAAPARAGTAQAVMPFGSFYQSNFKSMDGAAFARCHSKFPAKHTKAIPPAAAPKPLDMRTRPSVGTWMSPLPRQLRPMQAAPAPAPAPAAAPAADVEKPASVPFMFKPSVGTWLAKARQQVEVVPPRSDEKPSVGALLVKTPAQVKVAAPKLDHKPSVECAAPKFDWKPSVGSWLSPIPVRLQRSMGEAAAAARLAPAPLAAVEPAPEPKPSVVAQSPPVPESTKESPVFHLRPSVGSWLSPIPVHLQRSMGEAATTRLVPAPPVAVKPALEHKPSVAAQSAPLPESTKEGPAFRLRPSVGTWLMELPHVVQETRPEEPKPMLMNTMNRFGPSFSSLGLRPMMTFL